MSRTPSPRPAEPSRLLRLPEELLIAILDSFERYGVYQELKVLERVCKRLQRLVQDPHFDRALFRQGAVPLVKGDAVKASLVYGPSTSNVYELAACDEYATAPACEDVAINMFPDEGSEYDYDVSNEDGVTVRDVLVAVADYWETVGADSTYMVHGEHAFTGWRRPDVRADGVVCLTADFDH